MAVKRGGLGKGLDSLIPDMNVGSTASPKTEVKTKIVEKVVEKVVEVEKPVEVKVKVTKIEPNKEQPRKNFDEDALIELSESIKQHGVLQPILVQERKGYYEIIAGERRWRAAKLAGLKEVPVIIKKFSEQEIVEISLIENIQRENLNPIEEAIAYKRLLTEFHLKQDEVAERVSKSRTAVTNSMRLLKLDERVQEMVIEEKLSTGHARALLGIEDLELQYGPEYGTMLEILEEAREEALRTIKDASKRRRFLQSVASMELPELLKQETKEEVQKRVKLCLSSYLD